MTAVAAKLGAKKFIGGDEPSAEDVKLFNELLGENNTHLHRWVKNMASYTEPERKAWTAPAKAASKICASVDAAPAQAKEVKKVAKSAAVVTIKCKAGANLKELEGLVREIKVDGLDFGSFSGPADKFTWKCTFEDDKVTQQDLTDMTVGFKGYVESAAIVVKAC